MPANIKSRIDISIPNEGCLNDYYYVFKQKGTWKLWADLVRRQEPEVNQHGVQVATVDSARYSHLVEMHIKVLHNLNSLRNFFFPFRFLIFHRPFRFT